MVTWGKPVTPRECSIRRRLYSYNIQEKLKYDIKKHVDTIYEEAIYKPDSGKTLAKYNSSDLCVFVDMSVYYTCVEVT